MDNLLSDIAAKKAELDRPRPLSSATSAQLQKHYDVELTYTSNAIEGNTLTLRETAEVIEHGLTVGGKTLRDHLEAVDHCDTLLRMREIADAATPSDEAVVCELHRRIVARSRADIAGIYSRLPRRIAGPPVAFPNPAKIPQLMQEFGAWLVAARPRDGVRRSVSVDRHPSLRRRQRSHSPPFDEPHADPRRLSADRGAP